MSRLETIASRQRKSRTRDLVFACFIALVALIGATTAGATIHGVLTHVASR
jgi:fatty acid desaturase